MKIYYHLSKNGFTNSYLVVNDAPNVMQALIVDPAAVTSELISQIEDGGYTLTGVLVTHNHEHHIKGLETIRRIYTPKVYAADYEVCGNWATVLGGEGIVSLAGMNISYFSLPGHTSDSMVFRIENVFFTGDALFAGTIGSTGSKYAERMLRNNIHTKILSQNDSCVVLPGHGPPSTVGAERMYNIDLAVQK